jgi:nucleotide-binding universal stress UspA family protein
MAKTRTGAENRRGGAWLVAVDGSPGADDAARYAALAARRCGIASIRIVDVVPPPADEPKRSSGSYAREASERATANARRVLIAARLEVEVGIALERDPATAIVAASRKSQVDEIILGTRGMSALGNLALGSVAYKVLHLARKPVTLVPAGAHARLANSPARRGALALLLATDGSRLSHRAVDYVCRLARTCPLDVHLLNVQPRIVSGIVRSLISQAQIEAYYRIEGAAALRGAVRRLERSNIDPELHITAGPPAEAIVAVARETGCSRIVMGSRGLGAAGSLFMGSVAYGVVQRAHVPVTLVK